MVVGSSIPCSDLTNSNDTKSISEAMCSDGVGIKVLNNDHDFLRSNSRLWISEVDKKVFWRDSPVMIGLKIEFMESVEKVTSDGTRLVMSFSCPSSSRVEDDSMVVHIALPTSEGASEVRNCLMNERTKIRDIRKNTSDRNGASFMATSMFMQNELIASQFDTFEFRTEVRQEKLQQFNDSISRKESIIVLEKVLRNHVTNSCMYAFRRWTNFVRKENEEAMNCDRERWRLHAAANQEGDLQAWYHSCFYKQVYRLRGAFWYRDAVMPVYRLKYEIVDQALTPLEEAALAHVLCSPETTYGDVAGQMYIVQAIVDEPQFALFQELSARGANVTKCPRTGRPTKKLFRFSFVEGNIYLTWKGKFGNQGVDLGEVQGVRGGIATEVTEKLGAPASEAGLYLSLMCEGRSVDLRFGSQDERDAWLSLLQVVVNKENGHISGIEPCLDADATDFDYLLHGSTCGGNAIMPEVRGRLIHTTKLSDAADIQGKDRNEIDEMEALLAR